MNLVPQEVRSIGWITTCWNCRAINAIGAFEVNGSTIVPRLYSNDDMQRAIHTGSPTLMAPILTAVSALDNVPGHVIENLRHLPLTWVPQPDNTIRLAPSILSTQ